MNPLRDRLLQFPRIVVMLQLHHVLHRPVIALDLALGHRVVRGPTSVLNILLFEPALQLTADVTGAVVR